MAAVNTDGIRTLTEPTAEEAKRLLREVSHDDRIVGVIMKASGTLPINIYSLEQLLGFFANDNTLYMGTPESSNASRRTDVAYIAPERLTAWLREVIGDDELADEIDALAGEVEDPIMYPPRMRVMRDNVAGRVLQCYDVLGIDQEAEIAAAMDEPEQDEESSDEE